MAANSIPADYTGADYRPPSDDSIRGSTPPPDDEIERILDRLILAIEPDDDGHSQYLSPQEQEDVNDQARAEARQALAAHVARETAKARVEARLKVYREVIENLEHSEFKKYVMELYDNDLKSAKAFKAHLRADLDKAGGGEG